MREEKEEGLEEEGAEGGWGSLRRGPSISCRMVGLEKDGHDGMCGGRNGKQSGGARAYHSS